MLEETMPQYLSLKHSPVCDFKKLRRLTYKELVSAAYFSGRRKRHGGS